LLASSRAVEYLKLSGRNTSQLSLEFSGGWRQRIPFTLTFGDHEGGLRGFASSDTPGGQRFVTRLEDRQFLGRPYNIGDLGVGAFADAGRLWAGDIPYGVNTPIRGSVGLSLFGAVPAGSPRMWRVDLAYAVRNEPGGHRFELRLTSTNRTTFFLPEPSDISATRERSIPSSVFRWP
jgi:outer membrane protein assembly factor BamA